MKDFCILDITLVLWLLWHKVRLSISIKVPNENTIHISRAENLPTVEWIEKSINNRFSVADVALEPIRNRFLGLVVPNFE